MSLVVLCHQTPDVFVKSRSVDRRRSPSFACRSASVGIGRRRSLVGRSSVAVGLRRSPSVAVGRRRSPSVSVDRRRSLVGRRRSPSVGVGRRRSPSVAVGRRRSPSVAAASHPFVSVFVGGLSIYLPTHTMSIVAKAVKTATAVVNMVMTVQPTICLTVTSTYIRI